MMLQIQEGSIRRKNRSGNDEEGKSTSLLNQNSKLEIVTDPSLWKEMNPDMEENLEKFYGFYRATRPILLRPVRITQESASYYYSSIVPMSMILQSIIQDNVIFNNDRESSHDITWQEDRWCIASFCSPSKVVNVKLSSKDITSPINVPSGIWHSTRSDKSIYVQSFTRGNVGKSQNRIRNENIEFALSRPTTTLLLILLVGLAFYYWNYNVDPSMVSKSFTRIVSHHEYYRAFSGATAHFEPIHIAFNTMALYSLGLQLEGHFGSIPFLLYNISLIPITSIIMMILIHIQIQRTGNPSLADQSSVGYSGVLFAWMVVATLLSDQPTCPIPMMSDVCFHSYNFLGIRINLGPIVQLIVAQVLLRRSSFVGHLAGVISGFALYWNLLPLSLIQPSVLIPFLYLVLLLKRYQREETLPTIEATSISKAFFASFVLRVYFVIIAFGLYSGVHWNVIISLMIQTMMYYHCKKIDSASWWKAMIITLVLGIITDSMTLAGWILIGRQFRSNSSLLAIILYMILQLGWQISILSIASFAWTKVDGKSGTPFTLIFHSTVLKSATTIGRYLHDYRNVR